jgi:hypothetical protein
MADLNPNQFIKPTGISPDSYASGKYHDANPSAVRKVKEHSEEFMGRLVLKKSYPQEKPHF